MKADWDKLGKKYKDSSSVMIVDVDCTGPGQSTCGKHGVKGYPTIQYFMAGSKNGKPYQQGRDFASLDKFVQSTLDKASCDPVTGKDCKPIEKKFIDANKDKSEDELKDLLAARTKDLDALKKQKKEKTKEFRAQEKEWRKEEKKHQMATTILKALLKEAKKKSEL